MFSGLSDQIDRALHRLPIRTRMAMSVAVVAFVILLTFAIVVGRLNAHRQHAAFNAEVAANAQHAARYGFTPLPDGSISPPVSQVVLNQGAILRIWDRNQGLMGQSATVNLGNPAVELPNPNDSPAVTDVSGYEVYTFSTQFGGYLQYAQPFSTVNSQIAGLQVILLLGALIGTGLAFGAGSLVARRAMAPVAQLTAAAGEIERTGDPDRTLPLPIADDEIAELSRTLTGMLTSLAAARNETEATLERQREFVADASHELRTPLTSVLANLELLVDSLHGPDRDAAASALRSTQRMRRLVGDLLLLARADSGRAPMSEPFDLADAVVEAASELGPASHDHAIELDVAPTPLVGNRDDLQRVATNLIENSLHHTPAGTRVTVSTRLLADGTGELVVADDGPGIAPEARATLFHRFVRGAGDRGGSFGLGLAIVAAVAEAHHGTVTVDESPHGGARFTVSVPASAPVAAAQQPLGPSAVGPFTA
jgi:signal transduction histidine kinase